MKIELRLGENKIINSNKLEVYVTLQDYVSKTNISCINKNITNNLMKLEGCGFIKLNKTINLNTIANNEKVVFNLQSDKIISKLGKINIDIIDDNKKYNFSINHEFHEKFLELFEIYNYKGDWKFKILMLPGENLEEVLKIPNYGFAEDNYFDYKSSIIEDLKNYKGYY